MENQRAKLELELNEPRELMLLYDQPKTGTSNYGDWQLFALVDPSTGVEYSFFSPSDIVTQQLSQFNAGDKVRLVKTAKQVGKKVITDYSVTSANGGPLKSKLNGNGNGQDAVAQTEPSASDAFFQILESCYADAIRLQERFNGMVDVNRLAITLFIARSKTNGHALAGGVSP